ncbi:MAG: hypothetical protein QXH91_02620, partial [Candidatus Bathyarchaeia archaeon]
IKGVALHNVIQIENAHVAWFRGERQLRVGKCGKISVINSAANNIKMEDFNSKGGQNIRRRRTEKIH